MTTKILGNAGLGRAIAHFTKLGQTVCVPLTDSQKYDLIVDDGTRLLKVQVKASSSATIELRTKVAIDLPASLLSRPRTETTTFLTPTPTVETI